MEKISNLITNKLEELKKKHYASWKKYHDECAKYDNPDARHAAWFNSSEGKLHLTDGVNCVKCKNRGGFMKIKQNGYEVFVPCSCQEKRKVVRNLKRSGLEKNIENMSLDKYIPKLDWQFRVKRTAKKFLEQEKFKWFYICGQNGSGKTHICTAISSEFLNKNYSLQYISWRDEITNLKSLVYKHDETAEILNRLKTVDILYIDDFLKTWKDSKGSYQFPTSFEIGIAFEVLNARYSGKKMTLLSSEKTLKDLYMIDEAIASRVKEMCGIRDFYIQIKRSEENDMRGDLCSEIVEYG